MSFLDIFRAVELGLILVAAVLTAHFTVKSGVEVLRAKFEDFTEKTEDQIERIENHLSKIEDIDKRLTRLEVILNNNRRDKK